MAYRAQSVQRTGIVLGSVLLAALLARFSVGRGGAREAEATASPLPEGIFAAPNPVGSGESEVLVGALKALPAEAAVAVGGAGAVVLGAERLSPRAFRIRLDVRPGATSVKLRVESNGSSVELPLEVGKEIGDEVEPANLSAEEITTGIVSVVRPAFIYGFRPLDRRSLGRVVVYNEATGKWHQRSYGEWRARTIDGDGDGVPDEDVRAAHDDFLGIPVLPGRNRLRIVCFRRDGRSSLREIIVSREI